MTVNSRTVEVHGLEELTKTLKALPSELSSSSRGGILALALRDMAKEVKEHVVKNAPVGTGQRYQYQSSGGEVKKEPVKHGRLIRAVRIRRDKNPRLVGATENIQIFMRKGRSRRDMNGAWFWHFVNFGTEKQRPQPFFTNGFDSKQDRLLPIFEKGLDKRLKTAVKKAAKKGFELKYE